MRVLDLFSGIGGFTIGLEHCGFETVGFCEFDTDAVRVLNKNWPEVKVHNNILELDGYEYRDSVDIICGGFPCQDISIAGKGEGGIRGKKSGLWSEYKRIIFEARPKYAIIENVHGLLGRGLEVILQDLAEIGYDATWTTLDTKYCGQAQRRRRVYILAVRDGIPEGCDPFEFGERSTVECRESIQSVEKGFKWNIKKGGEEREGASYFTRQRSDEFSELGVSSTILKRDYKDFTDLIVCNGNVRRVTPVERLRLMGIPDDHLDGCGLSLSKMYELCGMSASAVRIIGEWLMRFDNEKV